MKAIVTVIGVDKVGIIAKVTDVLAKNNVNILDISQTIMGDIFTMIMAVDVGKSESKIAQLSDNFKVLGEKVGIQISITHEDIYRSMHRI